MEGSIERYLAGLRRGGGQFGACGEKKRSVVKGSNTTSAWKKEGQGNLILTRPPVAGKSSKKKRSDEPQNQKNKEGLLEKLANLI